MHACETNFSVYVADIRPHESKRVLLAAKRGINMNKNSPESPGFRYELRFYNPLKSRHKKGAVVTILSWLRPLP